MTNWFSADFHLMHFNIIPYSERPFKDLDEMHSVIIEKHNALVKPEDTFFFLGDFSLKEAAVPIFLPKLNGHKKLIMGNHDACHPVKFKKNENRDRKIEEAKRRYLHYGFEEVLLEMRLGPFLLHHMPYLEESDTGRQANYQEYRPKNNGLPLIHGHIHQLWQTKGKMYNVGVDRNDYAPVQYEKLLKWAEENK